VAAASVEVATAIDGEDGLEAAKTFKPDLVLLDVMMPKKDGFEVLQILRHDDTYNCTKAKIVLLTNLGDGSKLSEATRRDMDGYARADIFTRAFTAERPITFIPSHRR